MPDLAEGNKTNYPHFKLEYTTYDAAALHPLTVSGRNETFNYPVPLKNLPKSLRRGPVKKSKYTPYGLADLTVGSWVDLARRLSNEGEKRVRKRFRRYMYLGG